MTFSIVIFSLAQVYRGFNRLCLIHNEWADAQVKNRYLTLRFILHFTRSVTGLDQASLRLIVGRVGVIGY